MRSVQLVAPRLLEPREMPMPRDPGPGEALVRIRAVGICGSDMHWYLDGRIGRRLSVYPQILGHEPAGEVVAAGEGAGFAPGDRVAIEPAVNCGECETCRSGRHNLCGNSSFMGGPELHGLFREYAVVPAANLVTLPESMSFSDATVIEPLAVIMHVLELAPVNAGDTVAVVGAGPMGLLTIGAARAAGARRIFASDRIPGRLALAQTMGADVVVDARTESLADAVMDETRGRGVDLAFEAAGDCQGINQALNAACRGGTVVLIGLTRELELPLDIHAAMGKELRIRTVRRSNHNAHSALAMLGSGRISTALVTHRFDLEETPRAFEALASGEDGAGKIVIGIS